MFHSVQEKKTFQNPLKTTPRYTYLKDETVSFAKSPPGHNSISSGETQRISHIH